MAASSVLVEVTALSREYKFSFGGGALVNGKL